MAAAIHKSLQRLITDEFEDLYYLRHILCDLTHRTESEIDEQFECITDGVCYIYQQFSNYETLTIAENLTVTCHIYTKDYTIMQTPRDK